jgi:hypothetical protein
VSVTYRWGKIRWAVLGAVEDSGEGLSMWFYDRAESRKRGGHEVGIYLHHDFSRLAQPTTMFDDYLAHWDDDLVREYATHAQRVAGVHRARQMDREVVELIAPLVPVWFLRRDAKRWVTAYTQAHPNPYIDPSELPSELRRPIKAAVLEQSQSRWLAARIALGVMLLLIGLVEFSAGSESHHRNGVILSVLGIGNVGIAIYKLRSRKRA